MAGDVGSAEFAGVTGAEPVAQVKDYGRGFGFGRSWMGLDDGRGGALRVVSRPRRGWACRLMGRR